MITKKISRFLVRRNRYMNIVNLGLVNVQTWGFINTHLHIASRRDLTDWNCNRHSIQPQKYNTQSTCTSFVTDSVTIGRQSELLNVCRLTIMVHTGDVHGNGNDWDPTGPVGFLWEWEWRWMRHGNGNGNKTMGIGVISHCICCPQKPHHVIVCQQLSE